MLNRWRPALLSVLIAFLVCRWTDHGWLAAIAGGLSGSLIGTSVKGRGNSANAVKLDDDPYVTFLEARYGKATTGCLLWFGGLTFYTAIAALTAWTTRFIGL